MLAAAVSGRRPPAAAAAAAAASAARALVQQLPSRSRHRGAAFGAWWPGHCQPLLLAGVGVPRLLRRCMPSTASMEQTIPPAEEEADSAASEPAGEQQQQQHGRNAGSGGGAERARPRPTHFAALQVSHSPQVLETIAAVQASLVAAVPALQPCLLEPVTSHITLFVLHLDSQAKSEAAEAVLARLGDVLQQQQLLAPLQLQLQGLSRFRNQVLYLDVAPGAERERLQALAQLASSHFAAAGLLCDGDSSSSSDSRRAFTPHVTVAKTSRLHGRRHRGVKIPSHAWAPCADVAVPAVVPVPALQICNMSGRRRGEYFRVTHQLPLCGAGLEPPTSPLQQQQQLQLQQHKAAPSPPRLGPLQQSRARFKRLLSVLACGRPRKK